MDTSANRENLATKSKLAAGAASFVPRNVGLSPIYSQSGDASSAASPAVSQNVSLSGLSLSAPAFTPRGTVNAPNSGSGSLSLLSPAFTPGTQVVLQSGSSSDNAVRQVKEFVPGLKSKSSDTPVSVSGITASAQPFIPGNTQPSEHGVSSSDATAPSGEIVGDDASVFEHGDIDQPWQDEQVQTEGDMQNSILDEEHLRNADSFVAHGLRAGTITAFDMNPIPRCPLPMFTETSYRSELENRLAVLALRNQPGDRGPGADVPLSVVRAEFDDNKKSGPVQGPAFSNLLALPADNSRNMVGQPQLPFTSVSLKVNNDDDGGVYLMKRIAGCKVNIASALEAAKPWFILQEQSSSPRAPPSEAAHPNIVALRQIFMSSDFSDKRSLCMIYDFHAGAYTIFSKYFSGTEIPVLENKLWSIAIQLVMALSSIHAANLSATQMLDAAGTRVLVLPSGRVKIGGAAYFATATQAPPPHALSGNALARLQYEDVCNLGKLLLALASQSLNVLTSQQTAAKAIGDLASLYSPDILNFISQLLSSRATPIQEIVQYLGPRILLEAQNAFTTCDYIDSELAKEVHNSRLVRILLKLGYINERPEFQGNPDWSDTGNRYPIKLLRDFLFHQVNADGSPSVDIGFTIDALNKLDAGSMEKTLLSGRQNDSLLVVSYRELNRLIHDTFEELVNTQPGKQGHAKVRVSSYGSGFASARSGGVGLFRGPAAQAHGIRRGVGTGPGSGESGLEPLRGADSYRRGPRGGGLYRGRGEASGLYRGPPNFGR